jgi:hypothetical protein
MVHIQCSQAMCMPAKVESHLFALGSRALVVQKETQNLFARATERRHATRTFLSLTHIHMSKRKMNASVDVRWRMQHIELGMSRRAACRKGLVFTCSS